MVRRAATGMASGDRAAFWVTVLVAALTFMDLSKVSVALPALQRDLQASEIDVQLAVTGYLLAFALALVPAGRLGDMYSRRVLFLAGILLFVAASAAAALAPTGTALAAARVVQGASSGIIVPQVMGMIQQIFAPLARGRAFARYGAVLGVATAAAPLVGGVLVQAAGGDWGWRLVFWINVPLGLVMFCFALRHLPRGTPDRDRISLDGLGLVLLMLVVLGLVLPTALTTGGSGDDPSRWWLVLVSVAAAVCLGRWERRYAASGGTPVLDPRMLRIPSYRVGLAVAFCYYAAFPSILLVHALYLQRGMGLGPAVTGLAAVCFALASAVSSALAGRFIAAHGARLIIAGLIALVIGMCLLAATALFVPTAELLWISIGMTVAGAGSGIVISPNQALSLREIRSEQASLAGAVMQLSQRTGSALGVAVVLSTFYAIDRSDGVVTAFVAGVAVIVAMLAAALGAAVTGRNRA